MSRIATLLSSATVGLALAGAAPAVASPLTTSEILNQFNLVTFGDVNGTSHIDGRSLIGGNLNSAWMVFNMKTTTPASAYAELTVGGNVTGSGAHVNNGGDIVVGGTAKTTVNRNGGGTLVQNAPAASIPDFEATLKASSASLALLDGVAPTINGNKLVFGAAASEGTTVYNIDLSLFASINEIELKLNGADTVIINVSGTGATLQDNFLGGSFGTASNVLWNFYEATSLTFDRQFVGSVLAPHAHVTVTNNNIEGTLVADSAYIGGEIHLRPFTGTLPSAAPEPPPVAVPAPAALSVFLAGLVGLAAVRRRKAA